MIDEKATNFLRDNIKSAKLRYQPGNFTAAMLAAGRVAKRDNKVAMVYKGNSYMHIVYRVTFKPSEANNRINNTGGVVYSVTPDLEVTKQAI
jgi:hypothetical protein